MPPLAILGAVAAGIRASAAGKSQVGVPKATYLDKVVEEHRSNGGQGEPDEDGEGGDAGHAQRVEQVRADDGCAQAEQEGQGEALEDVPWNLRGFLRQGRYRSTAQRGSPRGPALREGK